MNKGVLFQFDCPSISFETLRDIFNVSDIIAAGADGRSWLLPGIEDKELVTVPIRCDREILQGKPGTAYVRDAADLSNLVKIVPGGGLHQLLCTTDEREVVERIRKRLEWFPELVASGRKVYIFAAHRNAVKCIRYCQSLGIAVAGLIDNDQKKHGTTVCGINVYGLEEIRKDAIVINASGRYCIEINEQLVRNGYDARIDFMELLFLYDQPFQAAGAFREYVTGTVQNRFRVLSLYLACRDEHSRALIDSLALYRLTLCSDCLKGIVSPYNEEFFARDLINFDSEEVFVDGGAYDGDSFVKFQSMAPDFKKAYLFEPDPDICDKMHKIVSGDERIRIVNAGLWSDSRELRFSVTGDMDGAISEHGEVAIKVVSLDELVDDQLSFVKLDIEGAEAEAMKGMKRHIAADRPKFAIAVYHKSADFWELPALVEQLGGRYVYSYRHYSHTVDDTVLYAFPA